jgi:hypothetical protein
MFCTHPVQIKTIKTPKITSVLIKNEPEKKLTDRRLLAGSCYSSAWKILFFIPVIQISKFPSLSLATADPKQSFNPKFRMAAFERKADSRF